MIVIYNADREGRTAKRYFNEYMLSPGINELPDDFENFLTKMAETDESIQHLLDEKIISFPNEKQAERAKLEAVTVKKPARKAAEIVDA
jgi:hypothetical protein